jgi:hypothetical protein
MDIKNRKILEALRMQPLSEEEMTARHILGRLYGPIATCVESTRNGRLYNKPLWEKALKDEIFLEKVSTKALFLELGHPADREETDMKQACACIPEVPKIVDEDLYAYVDILDTPNGRLLKTLVDYGFVPGISSRGSGDVMDNNQVDPETFFLETWDIVQLPAVKKARLNVCESLDSDSVKLKKALAESYKAAKEEDKDAMKKALENLNIDIEDELTEDVSDVSIEDIPWDTEDTDDVLLEESDEDAEDSAEELADESAAVEVDSEEATEEPVADTGNSEVVANEEEAVNSNTDDENVDDDDEESSGSDNMPSVETVGDAVEMLQEYDDDMPIQFKPIVVGDNVVEVDRLSHFIDDEDKDNPILVIGVGCEESDLDELESELADENIEIEQTKTTDDEVSDASSDEEAIEVTDESDSADDDGDVEVIESLKEMIRQKEALETEVGALRKAKAVGDAKEQELQEKLTKYQQAFKQSSQEAAKIPELAKKVQDLTEKLTQSKATIKTLTEKVNNARQLTESFEKDSKNTEKRLTESVNKLTAENKALEAKLEGQTKLYTKKLEERTDLAKTYKARFIETLNRYVESKANMLSVKPSEITSRLNENYTLADVDAVCDQILESTINFGRLPFGGRTKTSARISESVSRKARTEPEYGYEIDDDLLELAGLKK